MHGIRYILTNAEQLRNTDPWTGAPVEGHAVHFADLLVLPDGIAEKTEHITCEEEERQRLGYHIDTWFRYSAISPGWMRSGSWAGRHPPAAAVHPLRGARVRELEMARHKMKVSYSTAFPVTGSRTVSVSACSTARKRTAG